MGKYLNYTLQDYDFASKYAFIHNGRTISYSELEKQSSIMALNIIKLTKQRNISSIRNEIIAVVMKRSINAMITILAILKSGASYMPIDTEYPSSRITKILQESGCQIIISDSESTLELYRFKDLICNFDELSSCEHNSIINEGFSTNHETSNFSSTEDDIAYVLFTSGSTGKPKGVMVTHGNLINYINAFQKEFRLNLSDTVIQQASLSFDTHVEEIFPALSVAATIVIVDKMDLLDRDKFSLIIQKYKCTVLSTTPLVIKQLNQSCSLLVSTLRLLISGGDVLKKEYISNFIGKMLIYNTYGPTETTVCASYYKCGFSLPVNIPIGKAISGYDIYVMSDDLIPQDVNCPGEIYISGKGVSKGYLKSPEETKEKFIPDVSNKEKTMYKTGDIGMVDSNGDLVFLGRNDRQIKIRGCRLDLQEIENEILKISEIDDCAVIAIEENDKKIICAYFVSKPESNNTELLKESIRKSLQSKLPTFMMPTFFIQISEIPITYNGKVDVNSFPLPEIESYIPVEDTSLSECSKLINIFSKLLNYESVDIDEDFFELGGDSLLLAVLQSTVEKTFQIQMSYIDIYSNRTIRALSVLINQQNQIKLTVEKAPHKLFYQVTDNQKGIYEASILDGASESYNIVEAVIISGDLNISKVHDVFSEIVSRHESLRTSFHIVNGCLMQRIDKINNFHIEIFAENDFDEKKFNNLIEFFSTKFDLQQAPLIKVGIVCFSQERFGLILCVHHIVCDGCSINIIWREFEMLYKGVRLPDIEYHLKDFAHNIENLKSTEIFQIEKNTLLNHFKGNNPILNLQCDFKRPEYQNFEGNNIGFVIDKKTTRELKAIASKNSVTLYSLLFSLITILLSKLSNQQDVILGSISACRFYDEFKETVGMIANVFALKSYVSPNILEERNFSIFLKKTAISLTKTIENQRCQIGIWDLLEFEADSSRNPVFDVEFVFQNMDNFNITIDGLIFEKYEYFLEKSQIDISFIGEEKENGIHFNICYAKKLFAASTIDNIIIQFIGIINRVVKSTFEH